jgi:hypothetical protein
VTASPAPPADVTTTAPPGSAPAGADAGPPQCVLRAQLVVIGVLGCLPVATVLGAVPGRRPATLIEWMFDGFVRCALDGGALNPLIMTCHRAGAPVGMHQLDGGLSYPLGGLAVRAGVPPLAAWQLATTALLAVGFVGLAVLTHRLTGSRIAAAAVVALLAVDTTLTSRTWNWYWNTVAFALLPVLLLALLTLFDRARARRLRTLAGPAAGAPTAVVVFGSEWALAGLFAAVIGGVALLVLVAQPGWTRRQRGILLTAGVAAAGVAFAVLRVRLQLAGITTQFDESMLVAAEEGIDLLALVVPDPQASFLGWLLAWATGAELTAALTEGRHLWIGPYLAVGLLGVLGVLAARRRSALRDDPRRPRGFVLVLLVTLVVSIVLSLGPVWHVARVALPDAVVGSPLDWLWTVTPMRWVRYSWTWNGVTTVTTLVLTAALLPALARRHDGRWSPVIWLVLGVAVLELGSPLVMGSLGSPVPSVANATAARTTTADPEIRRFDDGALPELRSALASVDGPVMFLPWGNTWVTPHMGAAAGLELRNVGIDRNVQQAEEAAPATRDRLRALDGDVLDHLLTLRWVDAIALVDFIPTTDTVERAETGDLLLIDVRERRRTARAAREARALGYCTERYSWFTLVAPCGGAGQATDAPTSSAGSPLDRAPWARGSLDVLERPGASDGRRRDP